MNRMIQIDGSQGEGGGQILRSSLALSAATGQPFRVTAIRAGRAKPGLMRQHLTSIAAVQALCSAEVVGAHAGSQELEFRPGPVRGGEFTFSIGTAGATGLVLQAILPPLLTAPEPSRITIGGGTHAKGAPPFDFVEKSLLPLLNRMGPTITARLETHGFYPAGGGRIVVDVSPVAKLAPLEIHERGESLSRRATILHSQLGFGIADRELAILRAKLGWEVGPQDVRQPRPSFGPGNAIVLEAAFAGITEVFSSFGEMGRSAEAVAEEAAGQVHAYLSSRAPVGPYLADQLMVPMALAGGGSFTATGLTPHAMTNTEIIRAFLPLRIRAETADEARWSIIA